MELMSVSWECKNTLYCTRDLKGCTNNISPNNTYTFVLIKCSAEHNLIMKLGWDGSSDELCSGNSLWFLKEVGSSLNKIGSLEIQRDSLYLINVFSDKIIITKESLEILERSFHGTYKLKKKLL